MRRRRKTQVPEPPPNVPMYCPIGLCGKEFDSHETKAASLALVRDHMKKAHSDNPEYWED